MPLICIHCQREIDAGFKACPYCGEQITDFLRQYSDQLIDGKYRLLSRLGVGGMGEVYKSLHVHLNTIRVIKVLKAAVASGEGVHERFVREAQLATRIQHPNVAALHDFSTLPDGSHYMVWEYIEGTDLTHLIRKRRALAPRYAARIGREALLGLEAIHRAGIIHRDVSPDNIMIAADDRGEEHVKIIDLGIAKQGGETQGMQTQSGVFIGKWKYCSPEHLGMLDEGQTIDDRADLYSFGIVLYEMLTGTAPFVSASPHEYFRRHANDAPPPMRTMNPEVSVPYALEKVITKALEKRRENRYASAGEFAAELDRLIPTLPEAPPDFEQTLRQKNVSIDLVTPPPMLQSRRTSLHQDQSNQPTMVGGGAHHAGQKTDPATAARSTPTVATETPILGRRRTMSMPLFITLMAMAIVLSVSIGGLVMYNFSHFFEARGLNVRDPALSVRSALGLKREKTTQEGRQTRPEETVTTGDTKKSVELSAPRVSAAKTLDSNDAIRKDVSGLPARPAASSPADDEKPEESDQPGGFRGLFGKVRKRLVTPAAPPTFEPRAIIADYDKLRRGDSVDWMFVAPEVDLSDYDIHVSKFDDRSSLKNARVRGILEQEIRSRLRGRESSTKTLTTRNAIFWASESRRKGDGIGIEMIFFNSKGSVVAMLRHSVKGSPPENAARRVASDVAEFTQDNE